MVTCTIKGKKYKFKIWHLITCTGIILTTVVGATWGVSKAAFEIEDRYNQSDECILNDNKINEMKLDVAAMQREIQKEGARRDCEYWEKKFFQLRELWIKNQNDPVVRQLKEEAEKKMKTNCDRYEKMK